MVPAGVNQEGMVHRGRCLWCRQGLVRGEQPVSLTAFGTVMKGVLRVLYEEKNKRGFYVGIALVGAPKLVASGSTVIAAAARA